MRFFSDDILVYPKFEALEVNSRDIPGAFAYVCKDRVVLFWNSFHVAELALENLFIHVDWASLFL